MAKLKKKIRRKIRRAYKPVWHYIMYLFIRIILFFLSLLPLDLSMKICGSIAKFAFMFAGGEQRKILNNLDLAYGDTKTRAEKHRIAIKIFENIGFMAAENICLYKNGLKPFLDRIEIKGEECLDEVFKKGYGFYGITAHLDNWELLGAFMSQTKFATVEGAKFAVIGRRMKNKYIDKLLADFREKLKVKVFWREDGTMALLRFLKREKRPMLGVLADQNFKSNGIFVDFFGREAYTPTGPAELFMLSKQPLIVFFMHRSEDGKKHIVEINGPVAIELTDDKDENIRNITNTYTRLIEEKIKLYPEQWMWMHQRWQKPEIK